VTAAEPRRGDPAGSGDIGAAQAPATPVTRPADAAGDESAVILPDRVRRLVVDLAADVLGALDETEVPPALRRVRAFAPTRRAKTGAAPLGVSLERDALFRQRVAAAWRQRYPELAAAIDAGEQPGAVDPVAAAAGTFLCRPERWPSLLADWVAALTREEAAARREEVATTARADVESARRELERWRAAAATAEAAKSELTEEITRLRREQRRLRADADRARAAARDADRRVEEERARLVAAVAEQERLAEQAERRAQEAEQRAAGARRAMREGRVVADTRVRLLLDTLVDAANGLRRELALPPADQLPADIVAAAAAAGHGSVPEGAIPVRALDADDPARLDEFLRLPRPHLVVDGYNVTKTGYGTLPLADQRRRLVDGLASLAARTAAEVTCCFDGADVESRGPARVRGVRVLFSDPGVTADELIRQLVRAEPEGRVVIVVSSDGEVVTGVRASGAKAVPAAALLRLLGRG
jgi:predicted RNA-binding protein with PIN domain